MKNCNHSYSGGFPLLFPEVVLGNEIPCSSATKFMWVLCAHIFLKNTVIATTSKPLRCTDAVKNVLNTSINNKISPKWANRLGSSHPTFPGEMTLQNFIPSQTTASLAIQSRILSQISQCFLFFGMLFFFLFCFILIKFLQHPLHVGLITLIKLLWVETEFIN